MAKELEEEQAAQEVLQQAGATMAQQSQQQSPVPAEEVAVPNANGVDQAFQTQFTK